MGLLGKMGAAVGIGAARVDVSIPQGEYAWEDVVQGTATVRGGNVEQKANEVQASILEHWRTYDSEERRYEDNYRHHNVTVVARDVTVAADSVQEIPFEVRIPSGLSLSSNWFIAVRLGIPKASDPQGQAAFQLRLPLAIRGLEPALRHVAPFQLHSTTNRNAEVSLDFKPPVGQKHSLDGVKFIVRAEGESVVGDLEINPQEKSFSDRLKALAKKDRVRHPITFPKAELEAAMQGSTPESIVARLRELIEPYLK